MAAMLDLRSMSSLQTSRDDLVAASAASRLARACAPPRREPIVEWCERTVDMSYDLTSRASGPLRLYPYQREPLAATEDPAVRQISLMWSPRLGKSTIWKMSLLKRLHDGGLAGLIVYPSLDLGRKTNHDTVEPLLRCLPSLRADLARRGAVTKDAYRLTSAHSIVYYLGGGAQIVSYTAGWGVLDECDQVDVGNEGEEGENIDQLHALRLRMQTYPDRLLIACSSPTTRHGVIYGAWRQGSRHVWHLRCQGCGALHPASQLAWPLADGSYAGLQWRKTDGGAIIPDSIRWICPTCGRSHVEAEARAMSEAGAYVPQAEAGEHLSYQAGALANPWLWTWLEIAQAQEDAVDTKGRKHLANNILGRPYEPRAASDTLTQSIPSVLASRQQDPPSDIRARLACVTMGIDQQASGLGAQHYYVWAARGWDEQGNSWSLGHGMAQTLRDLDDALAADYCGQMVLLALMDQGGFGDNATRTDPWVAAHRQVMYYKGGDARTLGLASGQTWKFSPNQLFLVLASALHYQAQLLDFIYGPPRPVGYEWHIPTAPDPVYASQLAAVRPNLRLKDGRGAAFAAWTPGSERHDYFDAEKMALAAVDVCVQLFRPDQWPRRRLPAYIVAETIRAARRK